MTYYSPMYYLLTPYIVFIIIYYIFISPILFIYYPLFYLKYIYGDTSPLVVLPYIPRGYYSRPTAPQSRTQARQADRPKKCIKVLHRMYIYTIAYSTDRKQTAQTAYLWGFAKTYSKKYSFANSLKSYISAPIYRKHRELYLTDSFPLWYYYCKRPKLSPNFWTLHQGLKFSLIPLYNNIYINIHYAII